MSETVREIVGKHLPPGFIDSLRDDDSLSGDEIRLDSIAVVEVILECEARFGVSLGALLATGRVSIAAIDEYVSRAATQ